MKHTEEQIENILQAAELLIEKSGAVPLPPEVAFRLNDLRDALKAPRKIWVVPDMQREMLFDVQVPFGVELTVSIRSNSCSYKWLLISSRRYVSARDQVDVTDPFNTFVVENP